MRIGLFLVNAHSPYQGLQRAAATSAARALGVELEVFFAEVDSKKQREQVFGMLRSADPPAGVIVHPVEDAGLRFVAHEALRKGCSWVTVSLVSDWVDEIARETGGLAFSVAVDQEAIGRLQAEHFRALLPRGGTVLYVTGPSMAGATRARQKGMDSAKGSLISAISVVGAWSQASGYDAVRAWTDTTRGFVPFDLIGAQNDDMAVGARKALAEAADILGRPQWRDMPATGVDGMPEHGQRLVEEKTLAATIVVPPTAGKALELLAVALSGKAHPPAVTTIPVSSYPPVGALRPKT